MEKRVFRSWEDKRVFVFLISSIFTIPALIVGIVLLIMAQSIGPVLLAFLFFFILICVLTLVIYTLVSSVTLLKEGVLLYKTALLIIPYNQIRDIRSIYSKRDEQGDIIKPQSMYDTRALTPKSYVEFVLHSGERHRLNVDGITNRLVIKILEEIKVRALKYSDALKDFDPVSAVKRTKYTFKEPKDSFIDPNKLK